MATSEDFDQGPSPTEIPTGVANEVFGTLVIQGCCSVGSVFRGGGNNESTTA
jgi:hypothetical protein